MKRKANHIVLWGHTLEDYMGMFDLKDSDLDKTFLDYGGGPSSFTFEMLRSDHHAIAIDQLYSLKPDELRGHVNQEYEGMLSAIDDEPKRFVWTHFESLESLKQHRQDGMGLFFSHFAEALNQGCYLSAPVNQLPLDNGSFDLALCSHYFFGDRMDQSLEFHLSGFKELLRVASELRVFPILDSTGEVSPLLGPLMLSLQQEQFGVEVKQVNYAFQKNGNAMLRIWNQSCEVDDF